MARAKKPGVVGTNVRRKEALDKLTVRALYVADLEAPGALWGHTVRSPHARARIKSIRRDPGFDWSGVTVVTAADLPGMGCSSSSTTSRSSRTKPCPTPRKRWRSSPPRRASTRRTRLAT